MSQPPAPSQLSQPQRGGMFGFDARLALLIVGALGVLSVPVVDNIYRRLQADSFLQTVQTLQQATAAFQYDVGRAPDASLVAALTPTYTHAYRALYDRTALEPTAIDLTRWRGPYVKDNSLTHPRYGAIALRRGTATDWATGCTTNCFLWAQFGTSMPSSTRTAINAQLDGASESNPNSTGLFMWDGSGLPRVRLGPAL